MKNVFKLIAVLVFALGAVVTLFSGFDLSGVINTVRAQATVTPTPSNANIASNTAPVATPAPPAAAAGDKKMTKTFVLGKDSLDEKYHEVPFDHETHAFQKYSPDGKSVIGCVECHHTDQPKSALKPPLVTSERSVVLTLETWKASPQKVSECRACHFQDGSVPEGKEMPTGTFTEGGVSKVKDLNNQLAYHLNCNVCHDAAYKLRPELKKKPGFATGDPKDCAICHKTN